MISQLENLCGSGKALSRELFDEKEYQGLLLSGLSRLQDASNETLSLAGRFDLAYNASHALCLAALRRNGYRASQRYIVFQVLPHTLGLGPEVSRVLAMSHDKRNLGEYEGLLDIDQRFLSDLIAATQRVATALESLGESDA